MVAQSLIEYGTISSAVTAVQRAAYDLRSWLTDLSPSTWFVVAAVAVIALWLWFKRI